MIAALLATMTAVVWGAADFLGGLATRRAAALAVVLVSQVFGALALAATLPLLPGVPAAADLAWGAAAGVAGSAGIVLLYQALATGVMSVVAPVTAVSAAAVPVAAGLAMGERPGALALGGVALALAAVVLIAREEPASPGSRVTLTPLAGALAAGGGFGLFFVLVDRVEPAAGLWPLLGARATSVTLILAILLVRGGGMLPARPALPATVAAGVLDMAANVFFLLATQRGLLSLVAVLASLYPASTVLLAYLVLGERLRRVQRLGLILALTSVALVTLG